MARSPSSRAPVAASVWASRTNCCAPARRSSVAPGRRSTPARQRPTKPGGARSAQMVCDQGDYRAIDAFVAEVVDDLRAHRHPGEQCRRHGTHTARRGCPGTGVNVQGAPRCRRRLRTHGAVPRVRHADEPDQPAVVRHPGLSPDAQARTEPVAIINISSGAGHPAGSPTLVSYGAAKTGLNHLTRSLAEEWGPQVRVNCAGAGADDHRELPLVRAAQGRSDGARRTSTPCR